MTSITALTGNTPSVASAVGTTAAGKVSEDLNMFLKMLTTQMQNQDPLNPMDTAQYTQQLVQYSQVEQSIQQNQTLKDILASLTTQDMAQSSSFLGREAQFDTNVAGLTSASPAQWNFTADRTVGSLVATVTDSSGKVVDTRTIDPATSGRFSWDGKLAAGGQAAAGSYTLSIAGQDLSGTSVPVTVNSVGIVKQVTTVGGAVKLGVNGADMPAEKLVRVSSAD
ncbi:flagellar hook assembly protein FlgD [Sphingomonas sp. ac-8]|uniref:flagellar hook assembly protein FlgD n=1 Tax=Sphingomonas sp. ac-8 TaxID=3242977 RepID=UPI003A7F6AD7